MRDQGNNIVLAEHGELGRYSIQFEAPDLLLFCENETNFVRVFGASSGEPYRKDAFHGPACRSLP